MISISNNEKKSGKESAAYTYIYIKVALRAEDVCITWLRLVAYRANAPGSSVQVVGVYANAQILLFDQSACCQEEDNILLERLLGVVLDAVLDVRARMCWASRLPTARSTKQASVYVLSVVASNSNQRIYIFEETREEQRADWYFLEDRGVCVIVLGNQTQQWSSTTRWWRLSPSKSTM